MKKIVSLLAITAAFTLSVHASLIAGYDFQTTSTGGTAIVAAPNTPTTFIANFGAGTLYFDGTHSSSAWVTASTGNEITGATGTAINTTGTSFATTTTSPSALSLKGGTGQDANGKSFVLSLSTTGYQDLVLTFATQKSGTGFDTTTWSYSTDDVNFTTLTSTTPPASYGVQTVDFTGLSALYDQSMVYIKGTVTGATASTGSNFLDNIQLNASPVAAPEPSTLAGLALGGAFLLARRRRALKG